MRDPAVPGFHHLRLAVLALATLLPALTSANNAIAVGIRSQPDTPISHVRVVPAEGHWLVSGRLRLLSDPLPRSNPGVVALEAVAGGRVVAQSRAVVYRVVTADRRARRFHFRGHLPSGLPAGATVRVRHLPTPR
ncbi:MAG: hypothetical protein P8076_04290 [Gammaproteobacteria bacterium]